MNNLFKAVDGTTYTSSDFNTLEALPPDTVFWTLDFKKTLVKRLPRNLVVSGDLLLQHSLIEELPVGLKAHALDLAGSNIKHIPDNSEFTYLYLAGSNVQSIGSNIAVCNNLRLSHPVIASSPVICEFLELAPTCPCTYDLANFQIRQAVNIEPFDTKITGLKAENIYISCADVKESKLSITNSVFAQIKWSSSYIWSDCLTSELVLSDTVEVKTLAIQGRGTIKELRLSLDRAQIDRGLITIEGEALVLRCDTFVVMGASLDLDCDFTIKCRKNSVKLPANGVVYGNLTIPDHLQLPPSFLCLGRITRS